MTSPSIAAALAAVLGLLWLNGPLGAGVMFVDGSSMAPLLRPGQLLLVNRAAYHLPAQADPHRGDLVIFRHALRGEESYLVKRVVALPGESVLVQAGQVLIDGVPLEEPYVLATDDYTYPLEGGPVRVPDAAYFVLGDNRPQSVDSHMGWFVSAEDVVGEAWPLPFPPGP